MQANQEFRDPYLAYRQFEVEYRDAFANGITDSAFKEVFINSFQMMKREEFDEYFQCISIRGRESWIHRWNEGFGIWFRRQKSQMKATMYRIKEFGIPSEKRVIQAK